MNKELELYKLFTETDEYDETLVDEFGWIGEYFYVWVDYSVCYEFMNKLKEIFGCSLFDNGGFDATIQFDSINFVLQDIIGGYGIDLEKVFPKDKYKH